MHAALVHLESDERPKNRRSGAGGAKRRNAKRWNNKRKRATAPSAAAV
jgi:hypothetical protein